MAENINSLSPFSLVRLADFNEVANFQELPNLFLNLLRAWYEHDVTENTTDADERGRTVDLEHPNEATDTWKNSATQHRLRTSYEFFHFSINFVPRASQIYLHCEQSL